MLLLISLGLSAVLLFFANRSARRGRMSAACGYAFAGAGVGFPCALFPPLIVGGLLTALLGGVIYLVGGRPRHFLVGSVTIMVLAHVGAGLVSFSILRDRQRMREEYPVESLAERLAYEKVGARAARPGTPLTSATVIELDRVEDQVWERGRMRRLSLYLLHEGAVADFILSPGFGVMRRPEPSRRHIELPEEPPIPLSPSTGDPREAEDEGPPAVASAATAAAPTTEKLWGFHRDSVLDFVNKKGFGYVMDRDHVRGFQSHRFQAMPELPARWKVENLQLVSLLKHAEPVAYVTGYLPRMDQMGEAATRPLDDFEKAGLLDLQKGETLAVRSGPDRLRMLGAVRAVDECLKCHDAGRGDLLGAFSYTLRREP
jgi:hypothetical protein